ncbi:hypothetical protein X797_006629 [Metarhizium robertsii]|uniref:RING-type domain-containing protein n=2 Tax=Metarhizium robertsii TaxID=568076 RepID=A0A0B2XFZ2_METRA|nr:uncharacterized protein MAA_11542 [Metarhizium robertsii ARSEF 23]EXV00182.1 hypothetical protein X797_006629 [Metarhizium robertsii]KHO10861.1 hypothetical protein MAA_11542 [Metarhizium robertsii ARSEF 23]
MARVKDILRRTREKYGREYFERWVLQRRASMEPKEPLLTGRPIENDEVTSSNAAGRLGSPPEPESPILAMARPVQLPIFRPLRARCPRQSSSDSQATTVASTVRPTTSHAEQLQQPLVETSEVAPDDITPTPGPEHSPDCRFSIATTADANLDSQRRPLTCYICGKFFGKKEPHTKEVLVYLPCGHGVGHNCLFNWMTAPNSSRRCPAMPCITLRHHCEHITSPATEEPLIKFGNIVGEREAAVLPWDYGFCSSSKGAKLHASIKVTATKLRVLEAKQARGVKSLGLNQRVAMQRSVVERHERKLDELQKKWWTAQWKRFEQRKDSGPWAWQL